MKRALLLATALLALVALGCSDKTEVRVNNQLASTANVSFKPASGSTVNINGVSTATISSYSEISGSGMTRIHVSVSSGDVPADLDYTFEEGHKYTVLLAAGPPVIMTVVQD